MKKFLRILLPIVLVIVILAGSIWYLFVYDRDFTRDILLECARFCERQGNHAMSTWFYDRAYTQAKDNDAVAIELAEQYRRDGNYTKAEYTLSRAIADGGSIDVYIALCRTFVEEDKILDAVDMLNKITNSEIKAQLDAMRPPVPQAQTAPGTYNQYISVALTAEVGTLYASNDGEYPSIHEDLYAGPITLVDGENSIYAVAVADNGLVSPLAELDYVVGGVVKEMVFSDNAIEAAIRALLNADDGITLLTKDLWTIKEFTAPSDAESFEDLQYLSFLTTLTIEDAGSADLSSIATLTNLTELKITDTIVARKDLEGIAALPSLTRLTLCNCNLSNISALDQASNITYLDLSQNVITNIEPLASMSKLTEVYLQNNAVSSLTPLSGITTVTKLDISSNTLTTLEPLSGLTSLTWLNADTNALTNLSGVGTLTELTYLSAASNKLTGISAVANCAKLTELNISTNSITDISALSSLTGLMYLDFSYNSVEQLPEFPADSALVTITGTKNLITDLEPLSGLEDLNNVNMDYNEGITSVDCLAKCHNLIQVNVFGTKVKSASALTEQDIIVNYNPVS